MRRRIGLVVGVLLACVGLAAGWDEPTAVQGLRFGEELTRMMPECPRRQFYRGDPGSYDRPYLLKARPRCWMRELYDPVGLYWLHGLQTPEGIAFLDARAIQLDYRLEGIIFRLNNASFDPLMAMLKARYGPPTKESTEN